MSPGDDGHQLTLNPNWPGLEDDVKGTEIDRSVVRKVAQDLQDSLERVGSVPDNLLNGGAVSAQQVGNWDAGIALAATAASANQQITNVLQELLRELQGVIDALHETARTTRDAEEASKAALPTQSNVRSAG